MATLHEQLADLYKQLAIVKQGELDYLLQHQN